MATPLADNTDSTDDPYWRARHQLALAARQLNEKLISTDIPPERALELSNELSCLAASLNRFPQLRASWAWHDSDLTTASTPSWASLLPWRAEVIPALLI